MASDRGAALRAEQSEAVMSLRFFHLFFIVVSIVVAIGFGIWSLRAHSAGLDGAYLALGVMSLVAGVALVIYLFLIVKKLRRPELR